MSPEALILPMAAQVLWAAILYLLFTVARAPAVWHIGLAWAFVAGRVVHSGVQILTTNIRLRGIVFMINFVAVLGMWGRILLASREA